MYCVKGWRLLGCLLLSLGMVGCEDMTDDLSPDGGDARPAVVAGSSGVQVSQLAPSFTAVDTLNASRTLTSELVGVDGVLLYFTMWCPTCDSHMSHIRSQLVPDFPNVTFLVVDYVTGSVVASRSAQLANGYASFTVLADVDLSLFNTFNGSMGATVVIDSSGIVQFNEDYKDGFKVRTVLEALP